MLPEESMSLERLRLEMDVNGFCIIDAVIPPAECEDVESRVLEVAQREGARYSSPESVSFCPSVINHEQSFAPYLAEARLLSLVTSLLGHDARISFTSAIVNQPRNARGDT